MPLFFIGCKSTFNASLADYAKSNYSFLTNDSLKFWDGINDYGFIINLKDSSIIEYGYDEIGRRIKISYGDDIVRFKIKWKVNLDTLSYILPTNRLYEINYLKSISVDTLRMINIYPYNKKERIFIRSINQKSYPIEASLISNDTSKWIIKSKIK